MKNIYSYRKRIRNDKPINEAGEYVLYWMQINKRFEYNFALEYAVAWANKLNKPLLIYEDLNIDYTWSLDRFHGFLMQGIQRKTWAKRLQFVLEHFEKLFHPELFIIAGQISSKADKTLPYIKLNTRFKLAEFKNNAALLGAAYYVSKKKMK